MSSAGSGGEEGSTRRTGAAPLERAKALATPIGLAVAVLGMAAVTAGVVVRGLFLPGVVAVGIGLMALALGAAARAVEPAGS